MIGGRYRICRAAFDEHFWSTIPAIEGAIEGCVLLNQAGYDLICVSALDDRNLKARERNLRELGFPLSKVIATSGEMTHISPKASVLNSLQVAAVVDDYAPYLKGIVDTIHKALILRDPDGSPNSGADLALADSTHEGLLIFARWWLAGR